MRTSLRPSLLALPLLAVLAVGCDSDGLDADRDFGAPYSLRPDAAPQLVEDRIQVAVGYSGGCAEHVFTLRSDVSGDAATVWFHHDDNGDNCDAYPGQTLDARLPGAVAAADRITLRLPPQNLRETTIRLR